MFGLTSCLPTAKANRTRTTGLETGTRTSGLGTGTRPANGMRGVGLAIMVIVMLAVWAPSVADASGCTDSWAAKGSGSWFTPGNWSTGKVPTSTDEACITEAGTYTVTMTQTSTTSTVTASG